MWVSLETYAFFIASFVVSYIFVRQCSTWSFVISLAGGRAGILQVCMWSAPPQCGRSFSKSVVLLRKCTGSKSIESFADLYSASFLALQWKQVWLIGSSLLSLRCLVVAFVDFRRSWLIGSPCVMHVW